MPKYSLRWMLAGVGYVALGCVALLNANDYWAAGLLTGTILVLLVAIVGSLLSHGLQRAFWIGFAVLGCGHLWAGYWPIKTYWPYSGSSSGVVLLNESPRYLLTTKLTGLAHEKLFPLVQKPPSERRSLSFWDLFSDREPRSGPETQNPDIKHFTIVGHAIWSVLAGCIGGMVGRCFAGGESPTRDGGKAESPARGTERAPSVKSTGERH